MTSAALVSQYRSAQLGESCCELTQVILRAEQAISALAGHSLSVQFALSQTAKRVALPSLELEKVLLGLCKIARSLLSPGGRIVIETRGANDPHASALDSAVPSDESLARVLVRAERLVNSPARALSSEAQLVLAELDSLLGRFGGTLHYVSSSEYSMGYVASLPYALAAESVPRMPVAVTQQGALILLIDDEPQVLAVTSRILHAFGYTVLTAHSERTALAQAEEHGPSITLVISDLVLPGVSGKDLVKRLRYCCEQARVLYISGYSPEHVGALTDGARFLRKPFTAQELLGVVRQLLPVSAEL